MVYTMILSLIIIVTVGYIFTLESKRKLCILENQKEVTEKVYNNETTEFLFSKMNDYILKNVNELDKISVHNLFMSNPAANKIGNDRYYIYYSQNLNEFLIYEPYWNNKIKIDLYDYDFEENKIKFIYLYSKYN